jgi:hypothetical protein
MSSVTRLISAMLLALVVTAARADDITIPLQILAGEYEACGRVPPVFGQTERQTVVTLPPELGHIESLRLVMSGDWVYGRQSDCQGNSVPFSGSFTMMIWHAGDLQNVFLASVFPPEGVFTNEDDDFHFSGGGGPPQSFDALLGSEIEIGLYCGCGTACGVFLDAYGWINDVHLEITGTVPTEPSAWGTVKTLYR